jgi:hypothetical protein
MEDTVEQGTQVFATSCLFDRPHDVSDGDLSQVKHELDKVYKSSNGPRMRQENKRERWQVVNSNLYYIMGDDDWFNSDFIPLHSCPRRSLRVKVSKMFCCCCVKLHKRKLAEHLM